MGHIVLHIFVSWDSLLFWFLIMVSAQLHWQDSKGYHGSPESSTGIMFNLSQKPCILFMLCCISYWTKYLLKFCICNTKASYDWYLTQSVVRDLWFSEVYVFLPLTALKSQSIPYNIMYALWGIAKIPWYIPMQSRSNAISEYISRKWLTTETTAC